MAFTTVQTGQTIEAAHIKELQGAIDGSSGYGQAVALTQLNSSSSYALDVRNLDSSNGYVARFKDEADNVILTLTRIVATFGKKIVATLGSFTAAADMFSMTATWNAASDTFNAIKVNITNTTSATASRLLELQVGSSSKFSVDTAGVARGANIGDTVQAINEFKGWPPVVANDADLDALNLWWDKVGTPSTAPTFVDVAGESITETYEHCLKVVADGATEGLSQTWTYADEPRVKSGRTMSVLLAIWSVSSCSVTAKLVNSDATETAASAVTAAAWTIVAVDNHTLAGTSVSLQVTAAAAGTFYVVPLGASIGAHAQALPPRPWRYVNTGTTNHINNIDLAGAGFTDVDCTAVTSNLCFAVDISASYQNSNNVAELRVRRNGDSTASSNEQCVVRNNAAGANVDQGRRSFVPVDDSQIFEYTTGAVAGDAESAYIHITGFWEYA